MSETNSEREAANSEREANSAVNSETNSETGESEAATQKNARVTFFCADCTLKFGEENKSEAATQKNARVTFFCADCTLKLFGEENNSEEFCGDCPNRLFCREDYEGSDSDSDCDTGIDEVEEPFSGTLNWGKCSMNPSSFTKDQTTEDDLEFFKQYIIPDRCFGKKWLWRNLVEREEVEVCVKRFLHERTGLCPRKMRPYYWTCGGIVDLYDSWNASSEWLFEAFVDCNLPDMFNRLLVDNILATIGLRHLQETFVMDWGHSEYFYQDLMKKLVSRLETRYQVRVERPAGAKFFDLACASSATGEELVLAKSLPIGEPPAFRLEKKATTPRKASDRPAPPPFLAPGPREEGPALGGHLGCPPFEGPAQEACQHFSKIKGYRYNLPAVKFVQAPPERQCEIVALQHFYGIVDERPCCPAVESMLDHFRTCYSTGDDERLLRLLFWEMFFEEDGEWQYLYLEREEVPGFFVEAQNERIPVPDRVAKQSRLCQRLKKQQQQRASTHHLYWYRDDKGNETRIIEAVIENCAYFRVFESFHEKIRDEEGRRVVTAPFFLDEFEEFQLKVSQDGMGLEPEDPIADFFFYENFLRIFSDEEPLNVKAFFEFVIRWRQDWPGFLGLGPLTGSCPLPYEKEERVIDPSIARLLEFFEIELL